MWVEHLKIWKFEELFESFFESLKLNWNSIHQCVLNYRLNKKKIEIWLVELAYIGVVWGVGLEIEEESPFSK